MSLHANTRGRVYGGRKGRKGLPPIESSTMKGPAWRFRLWALRSAIERGAEEGAGMGQEETRIIARCRLPTRVSHRHTHILLCGWLSDVDHSATRPHSPFAHLPSMAPSRKPSPRRPRRPRLAMAGAASKRPSLQDASASSSRCRRRRTLVEPASSREGSGLWRGNGLCCRAMTQKGLPSRRRTTSTSLWDLI